MLRVRSGIIMAVVMTMVAALAVGCASKPILKDADRIAVVSFTLEKSIVKQGAQPDNGPGLLNKNKEDFYKFHEESLSKAWTLFKSQAADIFGASRLVDISRVEGNAQLLALTKPVSRVVMGKETSPAFLYVYPEGLNYANILEAKLGAKIASIVNADILVSISIKAEYAMSKGIGFGNLAVGSGRMILNATVTTTNAQGKVLRSDRLQAFSREEASITGNAMDPADYPRLIASAQEDLNAKLKSLVAYW